MSKRRPKIETCRFSDLQIGYTWYGYCNWADAYEVPTPHLTAVETTREFCARCKCWEARDAAL